MVDSSDDEVLTLIGKHIPDAIAPGVRCKCEQCHDDIEDGDESQWPKFGMKMLHNRCYNSLRALERLLGKHTHLKKPMMELLYTNRVKFDMIVESLTTAKKRSRKPQMLQEQVRLMESFIEEESRSRNDESILVTHAQYLAWKMFHERMSEPQAENAWQTDKLDEAVYKEYNRHKKLTIELVLPTKLVRSRTTKKMTTLTRNTTSSSSQQATESFEQQVKKRLRSHWSSDDDQDVETKPTPQKFRRKVTNLADIQSGSEDEIACGPLMMASPAKSTGTLSAGGGDTDGPKSHKLQMRSSPSSVSAQEPDRKSSKSKKSKSEPPQSSESDDEEGNGDTKIDDPTAAKTQEVKTTMPELCGKLQASPFLTWKKKIVKHMTACAKKWTGKNSRLVRAKTRFQKEKGNSELQDNDFEGKMGRLQAKVDVVREIAQGVIVNWKQNTGLKPKYDEALQALQELDDAVNEFEEGLALLDDVRQESSSLKAVANRAIRYQQDTAMKLWKAKKVPEPAAYAFATCMLNEHDCSVSAKGTIDATTVVPRVVILTEEGPSWSDGLGKFIAANSDALMKKGTATMGKMVSDAAYSCFAKNQASVPSLDAMATFFDLSEAAKQLLGRPFIVAVRHYSFSWGHESWPLVGFSCVVVALQNTIVLHLAHVKSLLEAGCNSLVALDCWVKGLEDESKRALVSATSESVRLTQGTAIFVPMGFVPLVSAMETKTAEPKKKKCTEDTAKVDVDKSVAVVFPVLNGSVCGHLEARVKRAIKEVVAHDWAEVKTAKFFQEASWTHAMATMETHLA